MSKKYNKASKKRSSTQSLKSSSKSEKNQVPHDDRPTSRNIWAWIAGGVALVGLIGLLIATLGGCKAPANPDEGVNATATATAKGFAYGEGAIATTGEVPDTDGDGDLPKSTTTATDQPQAVNPDMPEDTAARNNMYTSAPPMTIDTSKVYRATFVTSKGDIVVELFANKAPNTVNNFVFLAQAGFYDNTTFHRVLEGFMAQGGDPTGTGMGGPGYEFADEFSADLKHDGPGVLSMANAGPGTNGSQFFITFDATPWLDGMHTVFGKVVGGMDVLLSLSLRDPSAATTPGDLIETIRIEEVAESVLPTPTPIVYTQPGQAPMPKEPAQRNGMYTSPPAMVIDPMVKYYATFKTSKGDIVIELFADKAPNTVNNFVFLAREGFYDNTMFHRVIEDFMAQGGDPSGTGRGGPGYQFADEFSADLKHDGPGVLSMANSGPGTNGSQFFITFVATPWLDGMHTVFGKVVEGLDVLLSISLRDPDAATTPGDTLKTIVIGEGEPAGAGATPEAAKDEAPSVATTADSTSLVQAYGDLESTPYDGGTADAAYPGPSTGVRWLPALGAEDAPVTVIEFSEIGCGHCRTFNQNDMSKLLDDYVATGKVRYVGYYMAWNNPEWTASKDYLEAAMCAAEQGLYFQFEHAVFKNGATDLDMSAKEIELDMDGFRACREDDRYQAAVLDAIAYAEKSWQITGTPTFYVNDQKIVGATNLTSAIDTALAAR